MERSYPDGLDVEVFSFAALERAWKEAKLTSDREHVTTYVRKHPDTFQLANVRNNKNLGDKRWTLDRPEDFELIKAVITSVLKKNNRFRLADVLEVLAENPSLEKINQHITAGEGYAKSLVKDQEMLKIKP